jgi:ABC-type transporter Mla MlaB component
MAASEPDPIVFAIRGPLTRGDLPGLYERVCSLLATASSGAAFCDVGGVAADAVALDALARLQLAAGRHGCRVRLRHASRELLDLIALAGLGETLPAATA